MSACHYFIHELVNLSEINQPVMQIHLNKLIEEIHEFIVKLLIKSGVLLISLLTVYPAISCAYTNQLIHENSPYLLNHAHNPINWYAWNELSLNRARNENKPIFLSIGYAACHWCQVMEKESFNDESIASILNKNFISIKVDRESNPAIDELYGNTVMFFQGQQGWPMSLFLTPDAKPFYGGGYYNRQDFETLLIEMSDYWKHHKNDAIKKANTVLQALQSSDNIKNASLKLDDTLRSKAVKSLLSITDNYYGGFGETNKFPREPWLYLLLNDSYGKSEKNDSLAALRLTLSNMANGGINDQLGGGFHRYATDPYWKHPHFEKMLYNQALLIRLYLRTNSIYPDTLYTQTAEKTIDFLINELHDPLGGFYSSLNSDTEGKEGTFYLWSIDEWNSALTEEERALFSDYYDIDEYGETHNQKNILYISMSLKEYSKEKIIPAEKLQSQLNLIKHKLLNIRNLRTKPDIDKKIIMGWNGLVITALTESSLYLNNPKYLSTAIDTANFIWDNMQKNAEFYRVNFNNKISHPAQINDYAYYLQALISLYDIDKNTLWLNRAITVTKILQDKFWDEKEGGYFNAPVDNNINLPYKSKHAYDKTLPAGNAIIAQMLARLHRRTGNTEYIDSANRIISAFSFNAHETPSAYSSLLIAAHEVQNNEQDLPIYTAQGHIRIDAYISPHPAINTNSKKTNTENIINKKFNLTINIEMDDKWHINANQVLNKQLIPTRIELVNIEQNNPPNWKFNNINYPQANYVKTQFSHQRLALYQGKSQIKAQLSKTANHINPVLKLKLQACNEKTCLAPEDLLLYPRLIFKNINYHKSID